MTLINIKQGVEYFPKGIEEGSLNLVINKVKEILDESHLFQPTMPKTGDKLSVKMTSCGNLGWITNKEKGYYYSKINPVTKRPWPKMPRLFEELWIKFTKLNILPDCCLINYYDGNAKMGLHVDCDEKDFSYPILSISIGASALFRIGGLKRSDKTQSIKLNHGDVILMKEKARLIYHGIDKIYPCKSFNYRINLTFRKVL